MKVLQTVVPTPEQLRVIQDAKPGVTLIRGAAGSGKTTTALLRLSLLAEFWRSRRRRERLKEPVRILVLTYNRTLRGYITELADRQVSGGTDLDLTVSTFGKWSRSLLPDPPMVQSRAHRIRVLGTRVPLTERFLNNEIDYVLGRFMPEDIEEYLTCKREQRGRSPRVDRSLRELILSDVVRPYLEWKKERRQVDWDDLAVALSRKRMDKPYDVIVADEAQDFSANEVRALLNHLAQDHSLTFVLDAAQRIYPKTFQWAEVGVSLQASQVYHLKRNYRNTKEIAAFAKPIIEGLEISDDGALPDFESCTSSGPKPQVVRGSYSEQMTYIIRFIQRFVDLRSESVGFLHPKGGEWFSYTKDRLSQAGIRFIDIAGMEEWPVGPTNVALSTLHSAKGLEFDHVFIIGLNREATPVGQGQDDAELDNLRRLVAMGAGRARRSVTVSFKPADASEVVRFFRADTYDAVDL